MAKRKHKKKAVAKEIALERIKYLFELADREYPTDPDRSDRYVSLARRIGMRYRVSVPPELKKRMCKSCSSFLTPGSNCRVRLKGGLLIVTCQKCGNIQRYLLSKQKKP
ncbi:MAG: RNAse P, Rpr2/Rpp21 subunit [Methanolobus sp. T82-4]|nr:MAG: RNAse P, Rpr2/Rpp21 subunit [Methanolobus sp. T82-4]